MRRAASLLFVLALIVAARLLQPAAGRDARPAPSTGAVAEAGARLIEDAFRDRATSLQVEGRGVVTRLLADDNDGSRHQRFILRLSTGRSVLVAHNIDLAPRLTELERGDTVAFFGEYEWNAQGGVIHWTHHDPAGRHVAGWLTANGRRVQ